jgi:hypothetical protein
MPYRAPSSLRAWILLGQASIEREINETMEHPFNVIPTTGSTVLRCSPNEATNVSVSALDIGFAIGHRPAWAPNRTVSSAARHHQLQHRPKRALQGPLTQPNIIYSMDPPYQVDPLR